VVGTLVLLVLRLDVHLLLLLLCQHLLLPLLLLVGGRVMYRMVVLASRVHLWQGHVGRWRQQLHNRANIFNGSRHIAAAQLNWPRDVWKLPRLAVEHDMDPILWRGRSVTIPQENAHKSKTKTWALRRFTLLPCCPMIRPTLFESTKMTVVTGPACSGTTTGAGTVGVGTAPTGVVDAATAAEVPLANGSKDGYS
jgi:hypothetical protein